MDRGKLILICFWLFGMSIILASASVPTDAITVNVSTCQSPMIWNNETNTCFYFYEGNFVNWTNGQKTCHALAKKTFKGQARGRLGVMRTKESFVNYIQKNIPAGYETWFGLTLGSEPRQLTNNWMWTEVAADGVWKSLGALNYTPSTFAVQDKKGECIVMAAERWVSRRCRNGRLALCEFIPATQNDATCGAFKFAGHVLLPSNDVILPEQQAKTAAECAEECFNHAECFAFSHKVVDGSCKLGKIFPAGRTMISDESATSYYLI